MEIQRAVEILQQVILQIAREQGAQLVKQAGGCTLAHFTAALEAWKKGDAMEMEVLEKDETMSIPDHERLLGTLKSWER